MYVKVNDYDYRGSSSATKPHKDVLLGASFYEWDTTKVFMYTPSGWVLQFQMEED